MSIFGSYDKSVQILKSMIDQALKDHNHTNATILQQAVAVIESAQADEIAEYEIHMTSVIEESENEEV